MLIVLKGGTRDGHTVQLDEDASASVESEYYSTGIKFADGERYLSGCVVDRNADGLPIFQYLPTTSTPETKPATWRDRPPLL